MKSLSSITIQKNLLMCVKEDQTNLLVTGEQFSELTTST